MTGQSSAGYYGSVYKNANNSLYSSITFSKSSFNVTTISGKSFTHTYSDDLKAGSTVTTPWGNVKINDSLSATGTTSNGKYTFNVARTGSYPNYTATITCPQLGRTDVVKFLPQSRLQPQFDLLQCINAWINWILALTTILLGFVEMLVGEATGDIFLYYQGYIDYEQGWSDYNEAVNSIFEYCSTGGGSIYYP